MGSYGLTSNVPLFVTPDFDSFVGIVIVNVVVVGTDCTSNNLSSKSAAVKTVFALVKDPAFAKVVISPTSKL